MMFSMRCAIFLIVLIPLLSLFSCNTTGGRKKSGGQSGAMDCASYDQTTCAQRSECNWNTASNICESFATSTACEQILDQATCSQSVNPLCIWDANIKVCNPRAPTETGMP